tara:strand:+ start:224 stop:610 length:387 start_codon:yes stop_codon:yes gene_type:complete
MENKKEMFEEMFKNASLKQLEKFLKSHNNRPELYSLFAKRSKEMSQRRDKYSHWTIMNVIRWHFDFTQEEPEEFKVSNDNIGLYARLFIALNPEYLNFFTLKPLKRDVESGDNIARRMEILALLEKIK